MGFSLKKVAKGALGGGLFGGMIGGQVGGLFGSGLLGGGRAPSAPDPYALSNQQLNLNKDAAYGSLINQSGPFGSVNYSRGPDGQISSNTSLGEFGQKAYDTANDRLGMFSSRFGTGPTDFSADRQRIEDELYKRYSSRLDPQYGERERALMSRLEAQGITQGSQAYQRSLDDFNRERRGAYDEARSSAVLGGGNEQSRLFDLLSRERGQQFDEIGGLFGLSAAGAPQTIGHAGIGSPDLMGAVMGNYRDKLDAYNARQQGKTQLMSSLFSLPMLFAGGG